MTSLLEETIRLLKGWRDESSPVAVVFSDGPEGSPRTFAVTLLGALVLRAGLRVEVTKGDGCLLALDISGATFEYVEPTDLALGLSPADRDEARSLTSGSLAVSWTDGKLCVFSVLKGRDKPAVE